MDTATNTGLPEHQRPELDTPDTGLVVIVAPELRGRREFAVLRDPDDTDEDYQSRCDLFGLLLDRAPKA